MKSYEVIPKRWNANQNDWESDFDNCVYPETYKQAVADAKRLCARYGRVDIQMYQLNKSDCDDEQEFEERWTYDRADCLQWIESFANGEQCPVVCIGYNDIWRWNMKGYPEDLKPRNIKK